MNWKRINICLFQSSLRNGLSMVTSISELNEFVDQFGWVVENGVVHFDKKQNNELAVEEVNDERIIVKNALGYGKEMESIV
ncbi:unnamed protein product [Ambrosiozyma monospora]|uniref:Unnamed protein product n=1 Tax=Ambrosiozyma monospora TaxID=43982 RepID=A0ACB5SXC5_AMBMO|nr:unnamed protein product [Ambrosiozyma monospora]